MTFHQKNADMKKFTKELYSKMQSDIHEISNSEISGFDSKLMYFNELIQVEIQKPLISEKRMPLIETVNYLLLGQSINRFGYI